MDPKPIVSVIDEDPLWRIAVRQTASTPGLDCHEYVSGPEFVDRLEISLPGCVVLENRIPGLSGVEIQQHLALHAPSLPVVFVGGTIPVSVAVRPCALAQCTCWKSRFEKPSCWRRSRRPSN